MTAAYGAALPRVLSVLNDSLATEIVCVLPYKARHYGASGSNAESDRGPIPAARCGGAGRRRSAGRADQPARGRPGEESDTLMTRAHTQYNTPPRFGT